LAREWYLLATAHDQVSGYESEYVDNCAADGFTEALATSMAETVYLCNYDLSKTTQIRAFVENRVQDTKLQSLRRTLYTTIGTCQSGMYIKYEDRYWIIENIVDNNGMYEKSVLILCNWKLQWLDDSGKLIERWCNVSSASQYNNGETGYTNFFVRSNQFLIIMPDDNDSLMLNSGKRFVIDKRCDIYEVGFAENTTNDTSKEIMVYKLTRSDSVLFNYVTCGHHEIMVSQCEQLSSDGFYVVDGKKCWLASSVIPTNSSTLSGVCKIEYETNVLYNGIAKCTFNATFYDQNGSIVSLTPIWNISCDFKDLLTIENSGTSISVSCNNESLLNKSFSVELGADGLESDSVVVYIRSFL